MRQSMFTGLLGFALAGMLCACGEGSSPSPSGASAGGGNGLTVDRGPTSIALDGDPNGLFWDPDTAKRLAAGGADIVTSKSPEEFAAFLKDQTAFWARLVKSVGATAE